MLNIELVHVTHSLRFGPESIRNVFLSFVVHYRFDYKLSCSSVYLSAIKKQFVKVKRTSTSIWVYFISQIPSFSCKRGHVTGKHAINWKQIANVTSFGCNHFSLRDVHASFPRMVARLDIEDFF